MPRLVVSAFVLFVFLFSYVPQQAAIASAPGSFQLTYDSAPHVYAYPFESEMDRNVTVTNMGPYASFNASATLYGPNGFGKQVGIGSLPLQPQELYLRSGEANRIYIISQWSTLNTASWQTGRNYTYTVRITVQPAGQPSLARSINLTNVVRVLGQCCVLSSSEENVLVSGKVVDKNTGTPISGASVIATTPDFLSTNGLLFTDSSGGFYMRLFAYKRVETGDYISYDINATAPGYQQCHKVIVPKPGQRFTIEIPLTPTNQSASYSVYAEYATPLNNYGAAASADGSVFALTPFETTTRQDPFAEMNSSYVSQNAFLYFYNINGSLLWKFRLYVQTPAVDVSGNGDLVATSVQASYSGSGPPYIPPIPTGIYVLDAKGSVYWTYTGAGGNISRVSEVRFSHDARYLAAGDTFGNIYMFDLQTKQLLWQEFLGGQVRYILWDQNDSELYVSSGDGNMYAFNPGGTLLWRTYVDSWAHAMAISKDYIMASGKTGYHVYLLGKDGEVVWAAPTYTTGDQLVISPDESYMVYTANGALPIVYNENGTERFLLPQANDAAISGNGRYIVITGLAQTLAGGSYTYVSLYTNSGSRIWTSKVLDSATILSDRGYAWMSKYGTRIVVAVDGHVYFLGGSVTTKYERRVAFQGVTYPIEIETNSTISGVLFNSATRTLSLAVTGPSATNGSMAVSWPLALLGGSITVSVDGKPIQYELSHNSGRATVIVSYGQEGNMISITGTLVGATNTTTNTTTNIHETGAISTQDMTSTTSAGRSGGIAAFPFQLFAIGTFTVLVIASYFVVKRHQAKELRARGQGSSSRMDALHCFSMSLLEPVQAKSPFRT